jgi:hypothetical protein
MQAELKQKLVHLTDHEKQVLMPVISEYLDLFCNDEKGVLPCTTRDSMRLGQATPCRSRKTPIVYLARCAMKWNGR